MRLLVADRDDAAASAMLAALTMLGHTGSVARESRMLVALVAKDDVSALIIDHALDPLGGADLVRQLRDRGTTLPIILLDDNDDLSRKVAGLDAGADDYLIKPVAAAEVDARLRAILRRAERPLESGVLRAGDIDISEIKHRATRAGRPLALQNLEFRLLCELARHAGTVVTREHLYRSVWRLDAAPATNIVESHIRRLRAQLNRPGETDPIKTIRGVGYMLAVDI